MKRRLSAVAVTFLISAATLFVLIRVSAAPPNTTPTSAEIAPPSTANDSDNLIAILNNGLSLQSEDSWIYNPATDHCYHLVPFVSWADAEAQAVAWGGHLVTVNNSAEEWWLRAQFGTQDAFWIGLNDRAVEGNWVWSSGEPVVYTNWCSGEPNNLDNEDAAVIEEISCWNDNLDINSHLGIAEAAAQPPIATFTYSPSNPAVNVEVTFDASSSYDENEITSYDWSFGDGATAQGEMVTHTYPMAREYTVALTVTDGCWLTDTAEVNLEIRSLPVLLVHGYCSSAAMWGCEGKEQLDFRQSLIDQGFSVYTINLGGSSAANGNIWNYADELSAKIADLKTLHDTDQVDIVAHSMGGLVTRAYVYRYPSRHDIRTFIMLGTPNNGSLLATARYWRFAQAYLWTFGLGDPPCRTFGEASIQMTPGSPFLTELNGAGALPSVDNYYTIAGTKANLLSGILPGEDDGVVTVESVESVSEAAHYRYYVEHFEYDDDAAVLDTVVNILRGAALDTMPLVDVQQSTVDYQESKLIQDSVENGEVNQHLIPVDSTVTKVHFVLASTEHELSLALTSPDSMLITPTVASYDPAITYTHAITTLTGYTIDNPQSGSWTAHITISGTAPSTVDYSMLALFESDLSLYTSVGGVYTIGHQMPITATLVRASTPVTGAVVIATIESTDGATQTLSLLDEGSHSDAQANDGEYSGLYTIALNMEPGAYEVTITAVGTLNAEYFVRETAATIWLEQDKNLQHLYLPLVIGAATLAGWWARSNRKGVGEVAA